MRSGQWSLLQKTLLRLFYTRPRFMSPQAKHTFLEPDLCCFGERSDAE